VEDAPLVLFKLGRASLGGPAVAVVGSRAATEPGVEFARELARDLALAGVVVVSGMARGVDAAAHEGALLAGGETVAVLGCGIDVVYPPEAVRLRNRIAEQGALLSEFPPGTRPLPRNFPRRNRIVSGLAQVVVVAEAPLRSGALITARLALDQGREVMAVPGSPLFPHTAGSNRLLAEGAAPVTCAADVLAALGTLPWRPAQAREAAGTAGGDRGGEADREARVLRLLARERSADEMAALLGMPPQELLPLLTDMELRKLLARNAGGYYKRLAHPPSDPEQ